MTFGGSGRAYTLRIVGDVKDATSSLNTMQTKTKGFMGGIKGIAGGFLAGVAVDQVIQFGAETVGMASNVEQSVGAVESIYKGFSDGVIESSNSAAEAVGLSKGEYLELATTLGGQLKNAGVPLEDIAGQTDGLIRQASDLAATYGGTTAEAVEALGSAIRGEADPAERYALNLKQSALAAEAQEEGITKAGEAMDDTQRIQALLSLTAEQGADAQGAFARESDTLAGKQQRLGAQFDNVKTTIGQALLPVVSGALDLFQKLVKWVSANWPKVWKVIKPVVDKIRSLVQPLIKFLAEAWKKYGPVVIRVVKWLGDVIGSTFKTIFKILGNVIDFIKNIFQGKWKAAFNNVLDIFKNIWNHLKTILSAPIEWLRTLADKISGWISDRWKALITRITDAAKAITDWFKELPGKVMEWFRNLRDKISTWISDKWEALWTDLKDTALEIFTEIGDTLETIWGTIVGVIDSLWTGLLDGLKSVANVFISTLNFFIRGINSAINLINKIPGVNIGKLSEISPLAKGGIVTGPTLALLGERGPEAVIPLGRRGAMGSSYSITINAGVGDPVAIGRKVVEYVSAYERSAGRRWREVS